jgi:hypothetical protein
MDHAKCSHANDVVHKLLENLAAGQNDGWGKKDDV